MNAGRPGLAVDPAATGDGAWWGTDRVCVRFGGRLALDHVSFRAEPGRVSAVVGGDGAGRTTLLRCLAGALAASSGRVRRPGRPRIGYLCAGSGIYPDLTVTENLDFRAAAYRLSAAAARARSGEFLERAGLAAARDRLVGRLSGGMRQKLGVIAAMLHAPDLLVLDEPTTGVDPVSRAGLWWLIARAAADGAAVVLATSYLDEAERAFDVLVLDAGRQLAFGTPAQIIGAMPGALRVSDERPAGAARRRAWRREGRWRTWDPAGRDGDVAPDLQDAVTVAILARELASAPAGSAPTGSAPAGSARAGSASPGSKPAGSAPNGDGPAGDAPGNGGAR